MAFLAKSASIFLLTAFCFLSLLLLFRSSDCNYEVSGCVFSMKTTKGGEQQQQHRKLLSSLKHNEMVVFKNGMAAPATGGEDKNMDGWELRTAPLGPDPLHHHGGSPRKPRITP